MRIVIILFSLFLFALILSQITLAAAPNNQEISQFASTTLNALTILGSLFACFFLVKGGYLYITSSGSPDSLESAKKTIKNAIIGLILILSATTFVAFLTRSFNTPNISPTSSQLQLQSVEPITPSNGLTRVLIDSIGALLQNIIQSPTKPITNSLIIFLTTTPQVAAYSVIFNFWLAIVGIVDSLFALLIAVLGFQFMSATSFGFDEMELKQLLPRIGLAFLGANMSIFIVDAVIKLDIL